METVGLAGRHGDRILELAKDATRSIKILVPFVKRGPVSALLASTATDVRVLTSLDHAAYIAGVSDTAALRLLGSRVRAVPAGTGLHAKIYIFDDNKALVTSANLTNAAWYDNLEIGVLLDDPLVVRNLVHHFQGLWSSAELITATDLDTLDQLVAQYGNQRPRMPRRVSNRFRNLPFTVKYVTTFPDPVGRFGGGDEVYEKADIYSVQAPNVPARYMAIAYGWRDAYGSNRRRVIVWTADPNGRLKKPFIEASGVDAYSNKNRVIVFPIKQAGNQKSAKVTEPLDDDYLNLGCSFESLRAHIAGPNAGDRWAAVVEEDDAPFILGLALVRGRHQGWL